MSAQQEHADQEVMGNDDEVVIQEWVIETHASSIPLPKSVAEAYLG